MRVYYQQHSTPPPGYPSQKRMEIVLFINFNYFKIRVFLHKTKRSSLNTESTMNVIFIKITMIICPDVKHCHDA